MARKIANYTGTEGRDKGRLYLITEMSATAGEWWATRILMALLGANVNVPENFKDMGMAALAELGMKALGSLNPDTAKPLLDEMFDGIQFIPDPKFPIKNVRPLIEEDIDEISTRLKLRMEVWQLNMGFLDAVLPSLGIAAEQPGGSVKGTRTSRR